MALTERKKIKVGRRMLLAGVVALASVACATSALADRDLADVQVVDRDTGREVPIWTRDGRLFVVGEPGHRYSLRVTNRTGGRVLAVMSVDGVNIISGQTASYDQRGYVFAPHESYDISGWRKSTTEVAAFSFAPLPQSYAARTGRPGDVGVIGVAVFRERPLLEPLDAQSRPLSSRPLSSPPPPPAPPPVSRRVMPLHAPAPAPLAVPAPPPADSVGEVVVTGSHVGRRDVDPDASGEKLGTAHGAREYSYSPVVTFVRATSYPEQVWRIEYDTYADFVARGILPRGDERPRAFPSQPHGDGYVPDPPYDR